MEYKVESEQVHNGIVGISKIVLSDEDIVFICTNPKFHSEIIRKVGNGVIYTEEMDKYFQSLLRGTPPLETKFLAISVGQACSLKCKDCANFSRIDVVHIQGGEPFLYSKLIEILKFLEKYDYLYNKIQIATNGTIIPNEELRAYLSLHRGTIEIRISRYPNINIEELVKVLGKENIRYRIYDFANNDGKWLSTGGLDYYDNNENEAYQRRKVYDCPWSGCFTMENGKIGRCARSIPAISLQNIKYRDEDHIKIEESSIEDFQRYIMFIKPLECCKFCTGGYGDEIDPAKQLI